MAPYSQVQSGQLITALIDEPLSYYDGCGARLSANPLWRLPRAHRLRRHGAPPTVYVNETIAGTRRTYEGVNMSGRFELSHYIALLPSYSINFATLDAASARLLDGPTTTIVGAQLPNRPIHKGNVAIDGL